MDDRNTWPGDVRKALHQDEHERWNASHYPGTRQMCAICDTPTGRCSEDALWSRSGEPLCEECYRADDIDTDAAEGEE